MNTGTVELVGLDINQSISGERMKKRAYFDILVPISTLKYHLQWDLSLDVWETKCHHAGLCVHKSFDLWDMRRRGKIDWWDPEKLVVGRVTSVTKLLGADALCIVGIDYGFGKYAEILTSTAVLVQFQDTNSDSLPILNVPYAAVGAKVIDANSSKWKSRPLKKMKKERFRGHLSDGMVCSQREVGLEDYHDDIFLLPDDALPGTPLQVYLGQTALLFSFSNEHWSSFSLKDVIDSITQKLQASELMVASRF